MTKLIDIDGVIHIQGDPVIGEGGKVLHQMVRPATDEEMVQYAVIEEQEDTAAENEEGVEPGSDPLDPIDTAADPPSDPPEDTIY